MVYERPHRYIHIFFTQIFLRLFVLLVFNELTALLAHLSTKCSWFRAQGELLWSVNVRRPSSVVRRASSVVRRAASTIALKAYSSYTPGPIDLILGRKHRGDL